MKTPRQNWLAAFLIVCALLTPTHIQALEDIPAVPYKDVPEIVPYIQQDNTVETGDENINVAKVDLSSPQMEYPNISSSITMGSTAVQVAAPRKLCGSSLQAKLNSLPAYSAMASALLTHTPMACAICFL